jgi:branched-chain amino acid transport system ATP-binding protein
MVAMNLLMTRNLSRSFGGIRAVNDVNFELPEGEIRALIGPNGAGKTTFVSLLCGRVSADRGQVFFADREITRLPVHKRIAKGIGYTFQITSIFSRLTLYENVSLAVHRIHNIKRSDIDYQISAALDGVGLLQRASQIAGDMSYGHQRLLEIAMGLAQKPKLLILDEPTQGLAQSEITGFNALLRSITSDTTILLIEHNMDVVMEIADTITVLNFGEILAEGTPAEIRANDEVQAAYLGKDHA